MSAKLSGWFWLTAYLLRLSYSQTDDHPLATRIAAHHHWAFTTIEAGRAARAGIALGRIARAALLANHSTCVFPLSASMVVLGIPPGRHSRPLV